MSENIVELLGLKIYDAGPAIWRRAVEQRMAEPSWSPDSPLPTIHWQAPPVVTRRVLGRFLLDPAAGILHDVTSAAEACGIDAVAEPIWFAFALEAAAYQTPMAPCPLCLVPFARAGSGPVA